MNADLWERVAALRASGRPFVVATVVAYQAPQSAKPGAKAIVHPDGTVDGWVGGGCVRDIVVREARRALETGQARLIYVSAEDLRVEGWKDVGVHSMACAGQGGLAISLEPVLPRPALIILGQTPVAQALAALGALLDFRVTVVGPGASPDAFPEADEVLPGWSALAGYVRAGDAVVVATMGNDDEAALEAAVRSPAAYVGFVASQRKAATVLAYLARHGVPEMDLRRVRSPAGLDIGGVTPAEIALSILAEIVKFRRSRVARTVPVPTMTVPAPAEAVDPVCGMTVSVAEARYRSEYGGQTFIFCCAHCQEAFEATPEKFVDVMDP